MFATKITTKPLSIDQIKNSTLARAVINGKKCAVVIEHEKFLLTGENDVAVVSVLDYNRESGKYVRRCVNVNPSELFHF